MFKIYLSSFYFSSLVYCSFKKYFCLYFILDSFPSILVELIYLISFEHVNHKHGPRTQGYAESVPEAISLFPIPALYLNPLFFSASSRISPISLVSSLFILYYFHTANPIHIFFLISPFLTQKI